MDDSFAIHLVSNVSPDIYPNNKPSQFSTLLADTIDLNNVEWEVAVKDIMYPSHVASTTDDDKLLFYKTSHKPFRDLIPHTIDDKTKTVTPGVRRLVLNRAQWSKLKTDLNGVEMANILNNTAEKNKGIYEFGFNPTTTRMTLTVKVPDLVITLHPRLSLYLGWGASPIFYQGEHQAARPINDQPVAQPPVRTYMQFYDLQYMRRTDYNLKVSVDSALQSVFSTDITFDIVGQSDATHFTFSYTPEKGSIHLSTSKEGEKQSVLAGNRPITFFAFDASTNALIPSLHTMYGFYVRDIYLTPSYTRQMPEHTFNPGKATPATTATLVQKTITLTTWSLAPVESILKIDNSSEVAISLPEKEFANPKDFLTVLNKKASDYNYRFNYNTDQERFTVTVGKSHGLKMSDSLASILGFLQNPSQLLLNEPKIADSFPLLHRAITDIYIYSNIVQEVYLGNVKAPLLLSCPFRRDGNYNNITYIEFINPSFTALNRSSLQQIDIDIRDAVGKTVPFLFGRTVLNLIFRRRRPIV